MVKRVMITLSDEQYEILRRLEGFGTRDATKLRNIYIAYLSEHGHIGLTKKE